MSFMDTLFVGRGILRFSETGSTNEELRAIARERPIPEGFTLATAYQKSGRGQIGEYWESRSGLNLLQSTYFKPRFLPARYAFTLSMSVCLALRDLSEELGLETQIKWPNDLLLPQGAKVAGVLIENQIAGPYLESSIVGIGLNVNQKEFSVPGASSLAVAAGRDWPLGQVENVLLHKLERRYVELREDYESWELKQAYLQDLYGYRQAVKARDKEGRAGMLRIQDVHADGTLVALWEDGSLRHYQFKELSFFRESS